MLTVIEGDVQYAVKWRHWAVTDPLVQAAMSVAPGTTCYIYAGNPGDKVKDMDVFTHNGSLLHPRDQYNRNRGRKVSLARALQTGFPGDEFRSLRAKFWLAYRQMRGGQW